MRDNSWLKDRLEYIWSHHFADVERRTHIRISFGRRSYRRLGSIALKRGLVDGQIKPFANVIISSLLIEEEVPNQIIDQIIAHELVHYVHGFGSELPRKLRHPHQGGVIVKEFQKRGLWELYRFYDAWMKAYWVKFVQKHIKSLEA